MSGLRIGALASGRGSNVRAIQTAIDRGDLGARIVLVVSNNSRAGVLAFARDRGIPHRHLSAHTDLDPGAALLATLALHDIELLVLAGYMKKLDPRVVEAYRGRAINIHPAPLPAFGGPGMYGDAVHAAVLAAGVGESGPTVHRVTAEYDEGEILAHRPVPVLPDDDVPALASRVLAAEHDLYWRVIRDRFAAGPGGP